MNATPNTASHEIAIAAIIQARTELGLPADAAAPIVEDLQSSTAYLHHRAVAARPVGPDEHALCARALEILHASIADDDGTTINEAIEAHERASAAVAYELTSIETSLAELNDLGTGPIASDDERARRRTAKKALKARRRELRAQIPEYPYARIQATSVTRRAIDMITAITKMVSVYDTDIRPVLDAVEALRAEVDEVAQRHTALDERIDELTKRAADLGITFPTLTEAGQALDQACGHPTGPNWDW